MTRDDLLAMHTVLCDRAKELMKAKNHDYAAESDPFRNFRRHGSHGILVRMDDKFCRLQSFEENKVLAVKGESVMDTVLDVINYAVLYAAYLTESGTIK